jgi:F-box protein 9
MVVLGGMRLRLLDSDDDDDDDVAAPSTPENPRKPSDALPAEAFLATKRAWLDMYNNRVTVPANCRDPKTSRRLALIQRLLPDELVVEIFARADPRSVSRAACACRPWRVLARSEIVWRAACHRAWAPRESRDVTARIARERHRGSFRRMFFDRARVRTEGLYVSRNTYVKPGFTDLEHGVKGAPVHLVTYYRYIRFFGNGEFIAKTSPTKVGVAHKQMREKKTALGDDTVVHGFYSLPCDGDESRLHLASAPRIRADSTFTTTHYWLRLRGTHSGASNRLDFVKLASGAFLLITPVPVRPRRRGERRLLRTFGGDSLRPSPLSFDPDTPRRLSTPLLTHP